MGESIIVTGWGKEAGPAYKVINSELDKKRNKRKKDVRIVREQRGKSYGGASWALVEDDRYLLLNKGHDYQALIRYADGEQLHSIDAKDDYAVIEASAVEVVKVAPWGEIVLEPGDS
jgi:hypothetical protein